MPKLIVRFLSILMIVGSIAIGISMIVAEVRAEYDYENRISGFWSLADKSSTIPQKLAYINKFVQALEGEHLEGLHNAQIYPTVDNSFDHNFEALKSLQTRLREIQGMNPASFEYQTAIQQITAQEQGEAKPMLDVFEGCWWLSRHPFLWDWQAGLSITGVVLLAIVGIVLTYLAFRDRDSYY